MMDILTWKWEDINMDFVVGFPQTHRENDSIWVIVDRLTKFAHFIPVKYTYLAEKYARLYLIEIVSLHGIPLSSSRIEMPNSLLVFGGLFQRD